MDDVRIPWAKVVKVMGGETTVSATIQHLTKLRKRLSEKGHNVPPPPHRGGNTRFDLGCGTPSSEKVGDSYESEEEEAFNVEEDVGMARAKRVKLEAKDGHGDRPNNPGLDDGWFSRSRNPEHLEDGEGSITSAPRLRNIYTKCVLETLLECRRHSGFEPSLAGEFNPPIYNTDQIGGYFDEAAKYRAFDVVPDAAYTSQNIAGVYPYSGLELDRVPSVPEIANPTGRNEDILANHGIFPVDLSVDDSVGDPSFGTKAESQPMLTQASRELMGARSATHSITAIPEQLHQPSPARGQSLTKLEITCSNAKWLADTFPEELDEWNMGDVDDWAD